MSNNMIEAKDVFKVNEGQTIIIKSTRCKESFCMGMVDGNPIYDINLSTDLNIVKRECEKAGFPNDFILTSTDGKKGRCVYIIPESSTKGIALAIEEIERDGKHQIMLSRVRVNHFESNKSQSRFIEQEML